mgnify:CR=1 FL=1
MIVKTNNIKDMFRSAVNWRNKVNHYLETLDSATPLAEDKAVTYAVIAIIALLVFGAFVVAGMVLLD